MDGGAGVSATAGATLRPFEAAFGEAIAGAGRRLKPLPGASSASASGGGGGSDDYGSGGMELEPVPRIHTAADYLWLTLSTLEIVGELDQAFHPSPGLQQQGSMWNYGKNEDTFSRMNTLSKTLHAVCLALRIAVEYYYDPEGGDVVDEFGRSRILYEWFMVMFSLLSIIVFALLLQYAAAYKPLGVLIISIGEMFVDLVNFVVLLAAVTAGFSVCLVGMQFTGRYHASEDGMQFDNRDIAAASGSAWSGMWAVHGVMDQNMYDWLTSIIMWCYLLIGPIILVNLLVALFSDTYMRVKEASEEEYTYLQYRRMSWSKYNLPPAISAITIPFRVYRYRRKLADVIRANCVIGAANIVLLYG